MNPKVVSQGFGYAIYPTVKFMGYKQDKKTKKFKFGVVNELLFGDYVKLPTKGGKPIIKEIEYKVGRKVYHENFVRVRARNRNGFLRPNEIQPEPLLEVNFVDVGQGDACHIVTPDDKHYVIDAGKGDNMFRFLAWRFNLRKAKAYPPPFTVVISHSDNDHYGGFNKLFTHQKEFKNQFSFDTIYHNGIVEESGSPYKYLGPIIKHEGRNYVTDLCDTNTDYENRLESIKKEGDYIKLLKKTPAPKKSLRLGSHPIYDKGDMRIDVIGPVAKKIDGQDALPVFGSSKGITKNGHSVLLRLTIGKLRLLLGGDLNSEAEKYLFQHYANTDMDDLLEKIADPQTSDDERARCQSNVDDAIKTLRKEFGVDIAKSCHHGSADFTNEFMQAVYPVATIISSGDEESHCHPRPDTLGTIGKFSRGDRSLIFSTELARSTKEYIEFKDVSPTRKKELVVTVYGMINVRTDGKKAIIAQKLEKRGPKRHWDHHKLEWNEERAEFEYIK